MAICFPTPAATSAIAVNYTRRMITSLLPTIHPEYH
jgi:hypothetical protein